MTEKLENKIIELIDDYLKNGLKATVVFDSYHTDENGSLRIAVCNPCELEFVKVPGGKREWDFVDKHFLISQENSHYEGEGLDDIAEAIKSIALTIDGQDEFIEEDDGRKVYGHPLSAIAEALFELARRDKK
jgi:hypothetical protein